MRKITALLADAGDKPGLATSLMLWPARDRSDGALRVEHQATPDNPAVPQLKALRRPTKASSTEGVIDGWRIENTGGLLAYAASQALVDGVAITVIEPVIEFAGDLMIAALIEALFINDPTLDRIGLAPSAFERLRLEPRRRSMVQRVRADDDLPMDFLVARRSVFYQTRQLWLQHGPSDQFPPMTIAGPAGRHHPARALKPEGEVYRRYDPILGKTLSFRTLNIEEDLDLFHSWMNDGRVAFFWELAWSKEKLKGYLLEQLADPRIYGLIGCFDDDPAGYFETYWATEDRLGAHYDSHPFDRGWHGLIGNKRHLGRAKTSAWMRGLTHYLFLDDARTTKIVGEPNAAHQKMLSYADNAGYKKIKEFDFPHKRAALMHCERERFFCEVRL